MNIYKTTKAMILSGLINNFPEKVVKEVMDEYFYEKPSDFRKKLETTTIKDLFMNEIRSSYNIVNCCVFTGFFGEQIYFNVIQCGCMTCVIADASSIYHPELLCKLNDSILSISRNGSNIIFDDSVDNDLVALKIHNLVIDSYKRSIAGLIVVVKEEVFKYSGMHIGIALKDDIANLKIDIESIGLDFDESVIKDVDPEDFASGLYNYINDSTSYCI